MVQQLEVDGMLAGFTRYCLCVLITSFDLTAPNQAQLGFPVQHDYKTHASRTQSWDIPSTGYRSARHGLCSGQLSNLAEASSTADHTIPWRNVLRCLCNAQHFEMDSLGAAHHQMARILLDRAGSYFLALVSSIFGFHGARLMGSRNVQVI